MSVSSNNLRIAVILYNIVTLNVGCGQRPLDIPDTSEDDASSDEVLDECK